ncbi:hypothetical protein [Kibdelosporangium phytohabitans]|uniref:ESX-1 secretion-associated protein EspA/EspE-like domain-containing protein n=1 Tax=Kibdelosporangium phytohabitans TaxID=860235 RepID=A0A0N9HZU2_9PSEU|nr:hypothetical protein [Kibdelosporangium phytohabitans]ALG09077.1 hypothetical protein AOZ06_21075 [Kibdelosporangium phytohabitans]MBE1469730.1 hypothetical protein [Kibdelosporangium phytohabitans]
MAGEIVRNAPEAAVGRYADAAVTGQGDNRRGGLMSHGFTVRLNSITDFAAVVSAVAGDYKSLVEQLNSADLRAVDPDFGTVLGISNYAGSTEINAAAFAALDAYATLYSKILNAHLAILSRLEQITSALDKTHQLYAESETSRASSFRAHADAFPTVTGDVDGTAIPR